MDTIGERIRICRLTKNYSQEYMAFELNISQAAYSKLERDETELTVKRIFAIAEILEVSPYQFLPKPKYGVGINQEFFWTIIYGARRIWRNLFNKKK